MIELTHTPVRVTVLVENAAADAGLSAEHGLSLWVETADRHVLFDTGQTDLFAQNAERLGVDLCRADAIVLSHGHCDHTGGLRTAMQLAPQAKVFLHPDALQPKYSRRQDGTGHNISMPRPTHALLRDRPADTVFTTAPTRIVEGVYVTGPVPRNNDHEDVGGDFFTDEACTQRDALRDDQALFFRTSSGVVVLLGCAHAGVVNTMTSITALSGDARGRAILGGMHLLRASSERMSFTLRSLEAHPGLILGAAHCTGADQTALLWQHFPGQCRECHAGSRFIFD